MHLNNYDWRLDGGIPYKGYSTNPSKFLNKNMGLGFPITSTDSPGIDDRLWFGARVSLLVQHFEVHYVCLEGEEKGATYGGYQWGHSFIYDSDNGKYDTRRWSHRRNEPSSDFKRIVGAELFPER